MMSQPGKQATAIHKLPNMSRGKGNQTMKFGNLIEYNMTNISLEKSYKKCGGEARSRLLLEKSKLIISIVCQVEDYRNVLKLSCRLLAFTSYKVFLKTKKSSGTSLLENKKSF